MACELLVWGTFSMKNAFPALPRLFAILFLSPVIAHAHPGHDGDHGLSWDFFGDLVHRLASPYHLFPVFAAAVAVLVVMRAVRARKRDENVK